MSDMEMKRIIEHGNADMSSCQHVQIPVSIDLEFF
jgi:hypothetical protein